MMNKNKMTKKKKKKRQQRIDAESPLVCGRLDKGGTAHGRLRQTTKTKLVE